MEENIQGGLKTVLNMEMELTPGQMGLTTEESSEMIVKMDKDCTTSAMEIATKALLKTEDYTATVRTLGQVEQSL